MAASGPSHPAGVPDADAPRPGAVLFTAFEPSGDDHAAPVIAEIRARRPDLTVYAWGGPKMQRAGATVVEFTGQSAVMGLPGPSKIVEHLRLNRRIADWLRTHRVDLHVPVDSPGANFPICRLTKARGIRVVHLVAPQMWAWGPWRVAKLRRLTDLVLCLLPFEEQWFRTRGVPARFVGHPLFDEALDVDAVTARAARIPGSNAKPRVLLLPGSRPSEISRCFPVLLDAFRRLRHDFPGLVGCVASTRHQVEADIRGLAQSRGGWPDGLSVVVGDTDAAIAWSEVALVVSGTVTLQIARQRRPMVAMYRPGKLVYHALARWLVSTPLFTLPNLIAGRGVIPEFIPHFGDGEALAVAVIRLLRQPGLQETQVAALEEVCARFRGLSAARTAADEILRALDGSPARAPAVPVPVTA
ncbi:MAG: hypothetical protein JNM07_00325 [Phycisphaerae bacterium]|nr:hypothetical protein [Phycisphaerae bacterium]